MINRCETCGSKLSYVYFLYREGPARDDPERFWLTSPRLIKIGRSVDPEKRAGQVRRACEWHHPDAGGGYRFISPIVSVLAVMPGDSKTETEMHQRFNACRSHDEWFYPSPALMEFIRGLDGYDPKVLP